MKKAGFFQIFTRTLAFSALSAMLIFFGCKSAERTNSNQPGPSVNNLSQPGGTTVKPGDTILVRIGDSEVITWEEFNETYRLDRMSRKLNSSQIERLLDNLVNQRLLYMEGMEKGYDQNPEVLEQMERTKRQLISRYVIRDLDTKSSQPSQEEMRKYYEANPDKFEVTQLNYMLFNIRQFDGDAKKSRDAAVDALAKLKKGADFTKITEEVLGKKKPMVMTSRKSQKSFFGETFDTAVWGTPIGEVSGIIETAQGFVILKIIKREKQTFEEAGPYIVQDMAPKSGQNRIEEFYSELREKYPVTIDQKVLDSKLPKPGVAPTPGPYQPGRPPMPPRRPTPPSPPGIP